MPLPENQGDLYPADACVVLGVLCLPPLARSGQRVLATASLCGHFSVLELVNKDVGIQLMGDPKQSINQPHLMVNHLCFKTSGGEMQWINIL